MHGNLFAILIKGENTMLFDGKIYTELKDFPGYYVHQDWELIRETVKGIKICGQTPNSEIDPYWTVTVKTPEGRYCKRSMHRLLMETFAPNPENKQHVNHIDGDKTSRDFNNLEWSAPKENAQHAFDTGLSHKRYSYVEVHQYDLQGNYLNSFDSGCIAEQATGIAKQNISKCTLGLRKRAGEFMWSSVKYKSIEAYKRK